MIAKWLTSLALLLMSVTVACGQQSTAPPKVTPQFVTVKFSGESDVIVESIKQISVEVDGPYQVTRTVTEMVEQELWVEFERDGKKVVEKRTRRVPRTREFLENRNGPHTVTKHVTESHKYNWDTVSAFQIESELDELLEIDHAKFKTMFRSAVPALVMKDGQKLDPFFYSIVRPGTILLIVPDREEKADDDSGVNDGKPPIDADK